MNLTRQILVNLVTSVKKFLNEPVKKKVILPWGHAKSYETSHLA